MIKFKQQNQLVTKGREIETPASNWAKPQQL